MNDFSLTEEVLKSTASNTALMWSVILFVGVNILTTVGGIFFQLYLKKLDQKSYRSQLRETKRIEIYEQLSFKIEELTYFDGRTDNVTFMAKIRELAAFSQKHRIYTNGSTKKIITEAIIYFEGVHNAFATKDYVKEKKLFESFISEFNK